MKFLCDKSRLENAIAPLLLAIPTKESPKPSLKCLHLTADADTLFLRASNMEVSIEISLDSVKVDQPGIGLVPARRFHALLHEISDPTVEVEIDEGTLRLPTSTGNFEFVTADPKDFPELEFTSSGERFEVPIATLCSLYGSVEFACAREATKYAMNGVLMSVKDGKLTFVATDGRRLALNSSELDLGSLGSADEDAALQALLPHKCLAAVVRSVEDLGDENMTVAVSDASVGFSVPGRKLNVQRIIGSFPDYEAVIPKDLSNSVELNKSLFESNLRRTAVLTEDMNPAVKITFEGNEAVFESEAAGLGSAQTKMDVALSGPGGSITFNPNFIFDAMKLAQHDPVNFLFEDANAPGKFILGEQFLYIVMPITGV